jgi:cytochrome c biogenesis protein CcdA
MSPRWLRRILFAAFVTVVPLAAFATAGPPQEATRPVLVEVFERDDCGHCQALKAFLITLEEEGTPVEIVFYDVRTEDGNRLFARLTETASLPKATPLVLIGATLIQGFESPETTGERIRQTIGRIATAPRLGLEAYLAAPTGAVERERGGLCDAERGVCAMPESEPLLVNLPLLGPTDVGRYSLPAMAAILGFVDGFNPCAMWVLVTFLVVLLQVGNRERMFLVAGLFVVAEAVMYYLILNVWFTAWDFIGLDRYVTPLVGLVAMGGGLFFLYEWRRSDGTCQVTNATERSSISARIKKLATEPFTWLSAGGVIMLALSVNVIEFACSIGIPQAFTKIIELNDLAWFETQSLMFLYILLYMVDDLLVFGLALWGAERLHLTTRYARWCNFLGGILMLLLGGLLVFAPDILRAL